MVNNLPAMQETWVQSLGWEDSLEKILESPLDCKEIQPVHSEGDQPWVFFGGNDAKAEAPASVSVLPMNIQDWFPLGWTGWIPLMSKGLSRVFSNTTVQKHQFFKAQLSL